MATINAVTMLVTMYAFRDTVSWTVDLKQVREYYFQRNKMETVRGSDPERVIYFNEDNLNVSRTEKEFDGCRKYYSHYLKSYMEIKVYTAVCNGSASVSRLSANIQTYIQFLERCFTSNTTRSISASLPPPINGTMSQVELQYQDLNATIQQWRGNLTAMCDTATTRSEYVRHQAQFALWAVRRLQSVIYGLRYRQTYKGNDKLMYWIRKASRFLDAFANYTGFDPDLTGVDEKPVVAVRVPSTLAPWLKFPPMADDVMLRFMDCITNSANSSDPVYVRCRYPVSLPKDYRDFVNITDSPSTVVTTTMDDQTVIPLLDNSPEPVAQTSSLVENVTLAGSS